MNEQKYVSYYKIYELLKKRIGSTYKIISGLDPNAVVFDTGKSVLKIAKMDLFYADMHIKALSDIHRVLSDIHIVPQLMYIDYIDGYVISEFEKIETCDDLVSSYEAGNILGKAHCALKDIKVRKAYPWDGFYGEKAEFTCIIPLIKNAFVRNTAYELLEYISDERPRISKPQYVHRDVNPGNIIKSKEYIYLIDWDMAYGGYIEDDVAMSICCLGVLYMKERENLLRHCAEFLNGYRVENDVSWANKESKILISSLALSGLRQGVSGWFSDKGNMSAAYWKNIVKRMQVSLSLCKDLYSG